MKKLALILVVMAMAGCGGGGAAENIGGGLAFNAVWAVGKPTVTKSVSLGVVTMPLTVSTVRATVTAAGMTTVQKDFAATDHKGELTGVPAGDNRTLTLQGLDAEGHVLFAGSIEGIKIVTGVTTDAGTAVLQRQVNNDPVANAGPDQQVATGATVTLDGTASSDADGDALTYKWSVTQKPASSLATLSDVSAVKPTFKADKDGTYVVSLTITDASGAVSTTANVTVTATTPSGTITFGW